MNRKFVFSKDEYYHVYNRGTDKRTIFLDDADKRRFLILLYISNSTEPFEIREFVKQKYPFDDYFRLNRPETLVDIGSYCLMPNHFHILVKEKREKGTTEFMRKLSTAFTKYFNIKYGRTGHLLEGAFKAEHAASDRYLKYLFSYIHLNPLKLLDSNWKEKGGGDLGTLKRFLADYVYSSYVDYGLNASTRPQATILAPEAFPYDFRKAEVFRSHIDDFLNTEV